VIPVAYADQGNGKEAQERSTERGRNKVFIHKRRWLVLLGVLAASAALMTVACGGGKGGQKQETPGASPAAEETGEPTYSPGEKVPGVTDTEVLFGTSFPLSQSAAAAYSPITNGMMAYFDYVNDTEGGVNGRKIRLTVCDDHYNPPDAAECARQLVEKDQVFGMIGALGTAAHSAAWKYLEDLGVPDMWILSGATKWTDPVVETRFGGNPDYETEGKILGQYIAANYDGKKLGIVAQNDDFGEDGIKGLDAGIEGSNVEVIATERFEATAADLTPQMQRVKNAGSEVVAVYAVPPQAANTIKVAREVLAWDVPIIITGVSATDITIALAGPQNIEGVVTVVFAHQIYETENPGITKHIEMMQKYQPDVPPSNLTLVGMGVAELTVEALKKAGPDLTRDSFVDGAEKICDFNTLAGLVPISLSPTDHRPYQIEVYARAENGVWATFGEPVNFESTKECK
jgi:branched-chain amino acid transport system substrate-binding protein